MSRYREYKTKNGNIIRRTIPGTRLHDETDSTSVSSPIDRALNPPDELKNAKMELTALIGLELFYEWANSIPAETIKNNQKYTTAICGKITDVIFQIVNIEPIVCKCPRCSKRRNFHLSLVAEVASLEHCHSENMKIFTYSEIARFQRMIDQYNAKCFYE